jgi:tetratricopeptide (TPR) repeat protein
MKKIITHILFLIPSIILFLSIPVSSNPKEEFIKEQEKTIVTIRIKDKNNNIINSEKGLIISKNGYILTTCHMVKKWYEKVENIMEIEASDKSQLHIEDIISKKCEDNLIILKVKEEDLKSANIVNDIKEKRGDPVFLLDEEIPSIVKTKIKDVKNKKYYLKQTLKDNNQGINPLYNINGEVFAVLPITKQKNYQGNFAVSLENIINNINKKQNLYQAKKITGHKRSENPLKPSSTTSNVSIPDVKYDSEMYKIDNYEASIKKLQEIINSKLASSDIYLKLGSLYLLKGDTKKAIEAYQKAVEIEPKNPEAHFNLAVAYYICNYKKEAYKEYKILSELNKVLAENLIEIIE